MRYFKKICGERLYLSPINLEDVDTYLKWKNDLVVSINGGGASSVFTRTKEKEFMEKMSKEGHNFSIIETRNNTLIGDCSLMNLDQFNRSAEIGIIIGEPDFRGRGYGQEAIRLLLNYGFNILNLNSIYLQCFSYNNQGIACYKKCGLKESGRRREAYIVGRKKYDLILMDILADEYQGKLSDLNQEGPDEMKGL